MKIQIIGSGCPKCKQLEANVKKALDELGKKAEIEKVTDINKMLDFGLMATPALAIDNELKSQGKILSVEEIKRILQK